MKLVGIVVAVAVVLGLGYFFMQRGNSTPASTSMTEQAPTSSGTVIPKQNSAFSSIKDAMGSGQKLQCTYTTAMGDKSATSAVFVDGAKFKFDSTVNGTTVHTLFDGGVQYTWMGDAETGMEMSKACLDELKQSSPPTETGITPHPEDYSKEFDVAQGVKCEPVANVDFSVPTDVTFTDQCAMVKKSLKMMQDIKDKMPAGAALPQGIPSGY